VQFTHWRVRRRDDLVAPRWQKLTSITTFTVKNTFIFCRFCTPLALKYSSFSYLPLLTDPCVLSIANGLETCKHREAGEEFVGGNDCCRTGFYGEWAECCPFDKVPFSTHATTIYHRDHIKACCSPEAQRTIH